MICQSRSGDKLVRGHCSLIINLVQTATSAEEIGESPLHSKRAKFPPRRRQQKLVSALTGRAPVSFLLRLRPAWHQPRQRRLGRFCGNNRSTLTAPLCAEAGGRIAPV